MSNQRNDKQEEFCHFSSVLITQWEAVLKFAVTETCSTQTAGSRYKKEKRKKKKEKKRQRLGVDLWRNNFLSPRNVYRWLNEKIRCFVAVAKHAVYFASPTRYGRMRTSDARTLSHGRRNLLFHWLPRNSKYGGLRLIWNIDVKRFLWSDVKAQLNRRGLPCRNGLVIEGTTLHALARPWTRPDRKSADLCRQL